ncbi:transglycosylase SLT domain-containing protein [Vulgatibacter sp.]|uniref:lytic transglycosylase domain-containing protein n=1 Tax=Vulgatibacter sp. TaxID=1971226 RepID=UPI003563207C
MHIPSAFTRSLCSALAAGALVASPARAIPTSEDNTAAAPNHPGARYLAAALARSEAAARLAAGDAASAVASCAPALAVAGPAQHGCRLITAAAHLERHEWEEAAAVLAPARGSLGALEPWGALFLGEALAGTGASDRALALLDEAAAADPDGPLGRRAEVPAALALAHAGKLEPARQRLEALLAARRGPTAELRLALARALEAAGEKAEAVALFQRIWREHPDLPEATRAEERLAALRAGGTPIPTPSGDDRVVRIERLLERGHATAALAELEALRIEGRELELTLLRAKALGAADRKPEAEAILGPCLAATAPRQVRLEALELAARLTMRRMAVDESLGHLRRLEQEAGGATARSAAFLAAFFLYDAGRFAEAEAAFRAYGKKHGRQARGDEAAWYTAWSLYKQGKNLAAARELAALERRWRRSSLVDQAIYWQGRALERAGRKAEAAARYRASIARDPGGWYALLARERLGEKAPPLALEARPLAVPAALPKQPQETGARLDRAAALYAAGLLDEGGAELEAAIEGRRDASLLAAAAQLAHEAGDHHRAFRLGLFRLGGLRGAADIAFPEAFPAEVRSAAARFEVDPHFVWSIMRQESGFRPRVRSPAAAVGLMQLLPVTAERIAGLLQRPAAEAKRLEDPAVNVTFGTWYLAALLERFGGSVALAAAAYNAGPPAVARWMAEPARKDLPLDEFVESIPYRETRHYVKRVIGNMQIYRLVHGGDAVQLRATLPPLQPGVDF